MCDHIAQHVINSYYSDKEKIDINHSYKGIHDLYSNVGLTLHSFFQLTEVITREKEHEENSSKDRFLTFFLSDRHESTDHQLI